MASSQSTVTLQELVNQALAFGDIAPVLLAGGSSEQPALSIANTVMTAICGVAFPHKWNEFNLPQFYTNSYQQDYALINPDGTSVTNLTWLERGIVVDINNTAQPKPYRNVECGRQLAQATGSIFNSATGNPLFFVNWFPNNVLYYGAWGDPNLGNSTFGNNPGPGSVYTNPLGAGSMPANPITQITDTNGNLLVLTTYGAEGSTAPLAAPNASPGTTSSGTGASTIWTVVDPYGQGIRILPVPSQTGVVWEFNLVGQMKPVRFANLQQTLFPLPDQFAQDFFDGFVAGCYRYSPEAKLREKYKTEWSQWLMTLNNLRAKEDRELEENRFVPTRGIMGGGRRRSNQQASAAWPFNLPR